MKGVPETISKLDKWLDTMWSKEGYTGPVSHWWESSFLYTGVQIDWRYEGIITGYLDIYRKTGEEQWLEKAVRAGEDVVNNQLPTKKFLNSSFQAGPIEGGTPHEAAVDVALLELSDVLKEENSKSWRRYFKCAEDNIREYLLTKLWNGRGFIEQPWDATLVPNKNATVIEALLLYSEMAVVDFSKYVIPAAEVILNSQIIEGARTGGTIHYGTGRHQLAIGIYTARCVSGLLRLFNHTNDEKYLDTVKKAVVFLSSLIADKGTHFGYYKDESKIRCPTWISPSADILRALILARKEKIPVKDKDIESLIQSIAGGQEKSGGIRTANGFAGRGGTGEYEGLPEFRDVLPVVGWNDKVLRAFSLLLEKDQELPDLNIEKTEVDCVWKGRECRFIEDEKNIILQEKNGEQLYNLRKGQSFPKVCRL
ncbi:MAG: hypothetical protein QME59_03425 [Candidatus Hydrothermarchaeota archaeon]|nr:hypothetical protein [Candidatus Hydrothermarchaeota archaeon]